VLSLTNFGAARHLRIGGTPVGESIVHPSDADGTWPHGAGSCITVIATNAPPPTAISKDSPGACRRDWPGPAVGRQKGVTHAAIGRQKCVGHAALA
jgi:hypothetical protein